MRGKRRLWIQHVRIQRRGRIRLQIVGWGPERAGMEFSHGHATTGIEPTDDHGDEAPGGQVGRVRVMTAQVKCLDT